MLLSLVRMPCSFFLYRYSFDIDLSNDRSLRSIEVSCKDRVCRPVWRPPTLSDVEGRKALLFEVRLHGEALRSGSAYAASATSAAPITATGRGRSDGG